MDTEKSKKLGTESIGKLLWSYSIPSIISMVAVALYNIIDRIFIGQGVGPLAISGLALTLPLMTMITAIGTLVGVGAASRISI
ncbi:MAG: MATE family efflux transporter, partial [Bacteroidaceae bacterium]|nr:MATE family efflux transporter [Bacteroidaceae bacterium]